LGASHEKHFPFLDLPESAEVGAREEQNFGRFHSFNIIARLEIKLTEDEIVRRNEDGISPSQSPAQSERSVPLRTLAPHCGDKKWPPTNR
jgi:hypothetical protein